MGDRNHCARERAPPVGDDVTVVFHKVDGRGGNSCEDDDDDDDRGDEERTRETVHLQSNCHASYSCDEDDGEEPRGKALCPPALCVRGEGKPKPCPGLGLFFVFLSAIFFSINGLLVKTIQGLHAIEISAIRCFFQMLFVIPLLIYHKTGFLGPRDKRIYLVLRGFVGSSTMILLFYSIQQMPLADATVIMFSNPVFTAILAWIFLKERCTFWDCVFTVFALTGVVLIARPPFLFGDGVPGIEGNYTNHIKGTISAFAGAISAAFTFIILRKMGKSVHYFLSVWYYAVVGFIQCVIIVFVLGEWKIPFCGQDRWMLMLIPASGIVGQTFLIKALQIEKTGPVALMRAVDVLLAFIFQFIFFNREPTLWSLGGAVCVVLSTSGLAIKKWYSSARKNREGVGEH